MFSERQKGERGQIEQQALPKREESEEKTAAKPEEVSGKERWIKLIQEKGVGEIVRRYKEISSAVKKDKDFWLALARENAQIVLNNLSKVPEKFKENEDFWIACAGNDFFSVLKKFDKVPPEIRENKEIWLAGAKDNMASIMMNFAKVPEVIKQDKDFWLAGASSDIYPILTHFNKVPQKFKKDKDFWLAAMKNNIFLVLKDYDKIPEGVFTIEEKKKQWLEAARASREVNFISEDFKEVPEEVKADKNFWQELLKNNFWFVLEHYDKIPEGVFTIEEEEEHWLRAMEQSPTLTSNNFDKIPKEVREGKDFWLAGVKKDAYSTLLFINYIPLETKKDKDFWLAGINNSPEAVMRYYDEIPQTVKEEILKDDVIFNYFLEASLGNVADIIKFFETKSVAQDKAKYIYLSRMLALHPSQLEAVKQGLQDLGLDVSVFDKYQEDREELLNELGKIGREKLDTSKPSFNIEIESQNVHDYLEIETKVTNNYQEILRSIEKIDKFNQKIKNDIMEIKGRVVDLYDSVHINVGIPNGSIPELNKIEEDIEKHRGGLYSTLELTGLVYNPVGRSKYMNSTHYNDLICIDKGEAKFGYKDKLQYRYWSLSVLRKNASLLEAMFIYLDNVISQYQKGYNRAEKINQKKSEKIMEVINKQRELYTPYNYINLIDKEKKRIDRDRLEDFSWYTNFLPKRKEILSQIMRILIAKPSK